MKLSEILIGIKYSLLSRKQKVLLYRQMEREQEIISVMCILPGHHKYDQVATAINASGVHPRTVYMSLASGEQTFALERFYAALDEVCT